MADDKNQNLDDLEEKIKQEEIAKTTKKEMAVTGRSVFEIKKRLDKSE